MSIPQLNSCCCGCSLKTGTLIIAWLIVIGAPLVIWINATNLLNINQTIEDNNYRRGNAELTPEDEAKFRNISAYNSALKARVSSLLWIFTLDWIVSLILLVGTYKNEANLICVWVRGFLTLQIVNLVVNLISAFTLSQPKYYLAILGFPIELYCILVVHSYYRTLRQTSVSA